MTTGLGSGDLVLRHVSVRTRGNFGTGGGTKKEFEGKVEGRNTDTEGKRWDENWNPYYRIGARWSRLVTDPGVRSKVTRN